MNILAHLADLLRRPVDRPGVYRITNRRNGQTYIGGTTRAMSSRWAEHRYALRNGSHHNVRLQADWDHYGERAFRFSVLEVVEDTRKVLDRERHWQKAVQNDYTIRRAKTRTPKALHQGYVLDTQYPTEEQLLRWMALLTDDTGEYFSSAEMVATMINKARRKAPGAPCTPDDVWAVRRNAQ